MPSSCFSEPLHLLLPLPLFLGPAIIWLCCHLSGSAFWTSLSSSCWYGRLNRQCAAMLLQTKVFTIIVHVPTNSEDRDRGFLYFISSVLCAGLMGRYSVNVCGLRMKRKKSAFLPAQYTSKLSQNYDSLIEFKTFCSECAINRVIYILKRFLLKSIHTDCCLKCYICP